MLGGILADRRVRAALVPVASNLTLLGLKVAAALALGSVSLLADALDTSVDATSAAVIVFALIYAARPADTGHPYGHGKAENLASVLEIGLMVGGAGFIIWEAIGRLLDPQPLERIGLGIVVVSLAVPTNLLVGWYLGRTGRATDSLVLASAATHRLSDVWVSAAVLLGLILVGATGLTFFDPVLAIVVAVYILWTGFKLLRTVVGELIDASLPPDEVALVRDILLTGRAGVIEVHDLRSRKSGRTREIDLHAVVCGEISVNAANDLTNGVQRDVATRLGLSRVIVHIEPCASARDVERCPRCGVATRAASPP